MVTIKLIAQRCGLSTAAVSRALNHLPGVSPENAERVRQLAKEMGYVPNAAARTLKTNRTKVIGILYRNLLGHEFFSMVLEGIHSEAERCGYELTFLNSSPEGSFFEHARQRQCAGVILVQGDFNRDKVLTLINSAIPTVSIENEYPCGTTIVNDNVGAMEQIVHYLHDEMGHTRIAFIHGEICQVTNERLSGFSAAAGIAASPSPRNTSAPAISTCPIWRATKPARCWHFLSRPPASSIRMT